MLRFEAAKAAFVDDSDLGFRALVLAEHDDGSGRSLEVQRSSGFTDEHRSLGMDDYCVVVDGGVVHYGGVHSWTVSVDGTVRLELNLPASRVLGADEIEVVVDPGQVDLVRLGLGRILG